MSWSRDDEQSNSKRGPGETKEYIRITRLFPLNLVLNCFVRHHLTRISKGYTATGIAIAVSKRLMKVWSHNSCCLSFKTLEMLENHMKIMSGDKDC